MNMWIKGPNVKRTQNTSWMIADALTKTMDRTTLRNILMSRHHSMPTFSESVRRSSLWLKGVLAAINVGRCRAHNEEFDCELSIAIALYALLLVCLVALVGGMHVVGAAVAVCLPSPCRPPTHFSDEFEESGAQSS